MNRAKINDEIAEIVREHLDANAGPATGLWRDQLVRDLQAHCEQAIEAALRGGYQAGRRDAFNAGLR